MPKIKDEIVPPMAKEVLPIIDVEATPEVTPKEITPEVTPKAFTPKDITPLEAPKPTNPALYMCHVQCWLGTKKRFVNPGDVVEFYPGEYIPDFFTPL